MSKVIASVLVAAGLLGAAVGVVRMRDPEGSKAAPLGPDVDLLREDLASVRGELRALLEGVRSLQSAQEELVLKMSRLEASKKGASTAGAAQPVTAAGPDGAPPAVPVGDLRQLVAAVIDEEDRQREEEREAQREEFRQRREEERREREALSQGPYDRYNLKVNSMAQALSLTESQKQGYFELVKGYQEKLNETRDKLREERRAAEGGTAADGTAEDGAGRRGRGPGDRDGFREVFDTLQKEYATAVQGLLSPSQLEAYSGLSREAQSFLSTDMVSAAGDERGGPGGPFGGWGFGADGGGGRGRRGR
jgi:hypothetical protein